MTDTNEQLARLGPFFAVQDAGAGGDWRPLRALRDDAVLDERVAYTQTFLSRLADTPVEARVAASIMSLGLFSRLLTPQLGAAALGLSLPAADLDTTCWQPTAGGPWPMALSGPAVDPDPEQIVSAVVHPLCDVIADRYALSQQVLHGNVASSVFGAVTMIVAARPDLAEQALTLGRSLLDGALRGAGSLRGDAGVGFVRNSCCLYYRVPGGGYCGDCVLAER